MIAKHIDLVAVGLLLLMMAFVSQARRGPSFVVPARLIRIRPVNPVIVLPPPPSLL